jgi:hypothetical protein
VSQDRMKRVCVTKNLCVLPTALVSSVFAYLDYADHVAFARCSSALRGWAHRRESSSPVMRVGGNWELRVLSLRVCPRALTIKDGWDRDTPQLSQMTQLTTLIFRTEEVLMSCLFVSALRLLEILDIGGALFFDAEIVAFFRIVAQLPRLTSLRCTNISIDAECCATLRETPFATLQSLDTCVFHLSVTDILKVVPACGLGSLTHLGHLADIDNPQEATNMRQIFVDLPLLLSYSMLHQTIGCEDAASAAMERALFESPCASQLTRLQLESCTIAPTTFFARVAAKMPKLQAARQFDVQ